MAAVTTYYLEMLAPDDLRGKDKPSGWTVIEAEVKEYRFNRYLYQLVGEQWSWVDKLALSAQQWQRYAESEDLRTWVAYRRGAIAGYYELQQQGDNIEIVSFGLAAKFIGQGFGGYFLTHALKSAWAWGHAQRVWLHTCTLDHPTALANYQARGLKIYHSETISE